MAMLMAPGTIKAQNFDDYFTDKTLRVDYTFAGNQKQQMIAVDELNVMPRWYGKRQRLAELPVEGNGQITVRVHRSGKIIYRNSFSTLFQEWLSYPEAEKNTQSFENVFLVPMPKDTVDITLDLRNNRREITTTLTSPAAQTLEQIPHFPVLKWIQFAVSITGTFGTACAINTAATMPQRLRSSANRNQPIIRI